VIRAIGIGILTSLIALIGLFSANFALTGIEPAFYRQRVAAALADGSLNKTQTLPFAPDKALTPYGGNDCLLLTMLLMPRESHLKASLSPRMPVLPESQLSNAHSGYPASPHCTTLAVAMAPDRAAGPSPVVYYHRYLHANSTVAAAMLALLPFATVSLIFMTVSHMLLVVLAGGALWQLRRADGATRWRPIAFATMSVVLLATFGLNHFGWQIAGAPTDIALLLFLLYAFLRPLCRVPETEFLIAVSVFAAAIILLELLTGGLPTALTLLIALVALGEPAEARTLCHRLAAGFAAFVAAVAAAFAFKLIAIGVVWGRAEVMDFFVVLGDRMVGPIEARLPSRLVDFYAHFGWSAQTADSSPFVRLLSAGAMVVYSSFALAWGSHVVGALIVLLPVPILAWLSLGPIVRGNGLDRLQALALFAAGLVPYLWYAAFTNHTITHSLFMVRPLAMSLSVAAAAVVIRLARPRPAA
jgi:hypothetical protein